MNKIECLDYGFVKLLNISGPVRRVIAYNHISTGELKGTEPIINKGVPTLYDADTTDIARSARICFDNFEEERTREQDLKLVDYLIRNKHTSPVEMIEVWLEMKLPIFIARQFVRHRTCVINEVSARYSVLPEEYYIPEIVGGKSTSGSKQGQEDSLPLVIQRYFKISLKSQCTESYKLYKAALESGVAPEHARLLLHVNHYTHWIWKQNLHNLFHFLSLRLHSHAQLEARIYAEAIYNLLKEVIPDAMDLFDKYRRL
jgi:thymidylate synthase (FAD)